MLLTTTPHRLCATLGCALLLHACGDDDSARTHDAGFSSDASVLDAARPTPDAGAMVDAAMPLAKDAGSYVPPLTLAESGLYSDAKHEVLAHGVHEFEPSFPLWSDGATKKRYLYLPPCTQIDTSNMNRWVFPVGTKAWKEFTRDGIRVETRLLEKTAFGWYAVAYVWDSGQTTAVAMPAGQTNANGTEHDVPASSTCLFCHVGEADKLLGVSAIQLSHAKPGLNLTTLTKLGLLSSPPSSAFTLPGTATDQAALGALHANCGHCHNPLGAGWDRAVGMNLRLNPSKLDSVAATPTYSTTVNQALVSMVVPDAAVRILPGQPDMSGLLLRLEAPRGPGGSALVMPPLATELTDSDTAYAVRQWIVNLAP